MPFLNKKPKVLVVCENQGWLLHRVARELEGPETADFHFIFLYGVRRHLFNIVAKFLRFRFDIVYFFPYYLFSRNISRSGSSVFSHLTHFESDSKFKSKKWEECSKFAMNFTAMSRFTLEQALIKGLDENSIEVIRYGLDEIYKPTFNILISGNTGKRKGEFFFKQVKTLCENLELPTVWMCTKSNSWGLKSFDLNHSDLRIPYSWADLLLVTSELEGGHVGTLEAVAMGLPVVTTDVGWAYSELRNSVKIVNSPEEMVSQIQLLLNNRFQSLLIEQTNLSDFTYKAFRENHTKLFTKKLKSNI